MPPPPTTTTTAANKERSAYEQYRDLTSDRTSDRHGGSSGDGTDSSAQAQRGGATIMYHSQGQAVSQAVMAENASDSEEIVE
jgi:hypothetical protein